MAAMLWTLACAWLSLLLCSDAQLVVNVKDRGGDVQVESINANTSADTVTLEYLNSDGTLVTQFIDFKSEAQVFRAVIPPEEERGETELQTLCFVLRFTKSDFISSDAMSKLRQKNPTAIRTPEEERGSEVIMEDVVVDLNKSHVISQHLHNICRDAADSTHARDSDLHTIARSLGKDVPTLMSAVHPSYPEKFVKCRDSTDLIRPCVCRYDACVGWYPCGLKYCRGKDSAGKLVSYRCGIKTCKRCLAFDFVARKKLLCLWDDA